MQRFSYLGAVAGNRFTSYGAPVTPYLTNATKDHVYQQAQLDGSKARQFTTAFGRTVWKYKCIYCEADDTVTSAEACWHVRESTQVDHRIPWNAIAANYTTYYHWINTGDPDFANHCQAIHNDLDNLHIVCTNHNSTSQKGKKKDFHRKKVMSIPFLVHHKIGSSGEGMSSVYDVNSVGGSGYWGPEW